MSESAIVVKVEQQVGEVRWNFEEIKQRLNEKLDFYRNNVYTDETIGTAKTDVAELRKLVKEIDSRRIEVKNKCLEPYNIIETQAKELTALIDEPIKEIDKQVKEYECKRKARVRDEIFKYWQKVSISIPEEIRDKVYEQNYDSRWENATATKKSWHEAIDKIVSDVSDSIATIKSMNSEYETDGIKVYYETLSLQRAIQKMNELREQAERIRKQEAERIRREEEERIRREERERQAREIAAQEAAKKEQAAQEAAEKAREAIKEAPKTEPETIPTPEPVQAAIKPQETPEQESKQIADNIFNASVRKTVRLEISGTVTEIEKIKSFITYTGAIFTEV